MADDSFFLASYAAADGRPRAALVVDRELIDVVAALAHFNIQGFAEASSVLAVLRHWDSLRPHLRQAAAVAREGELSRLSMPLAAAKLLAPILYPGAIFCAGANYRDHVQEMSRALNLPPEPDPHELGLKPWHFMKAAAACVRATGSRIELPAYSSKVDWEAEIAIVIGRECRNVSIGEALDYAAGITIANDLSARDHLKRPAVAAGSPFHFDWVSQKCFDGALPLGPWICPLEDAGDPGNLGIRLWVNDELMQDSNSSNLIFSMAEQIAHLSTRLTLMPGDVIATGTPAGCGAARGRFLKAGDRVRIWVQNIGELASEFA